MIYNVTITKWQDHNKKHRKGMGYFKFYNGFLTDNKIANLTPIEVILYIHCLCVASESSTNQIQITSKTLPKQLRMGDKSLTNGLGRLKSFQLVTYEITQPIKLKDIKLKDIKLNLIPVGVAKAPPHVEKSDQQNLFPDETKNLRTECWEFYKKAYIEVWKKEPVRNATINSQIAALAKRLGADAPMVLDFYVHHKDGFYVKNCHPVGFCLKNAEGLHTQWKNGMQITGAKMRQYENNQHYSEQIERIKRGDV